MTVGTNKIKEGKAYVFIRLNDVWVEAAKINAPIDSSYYFGKKVALLLKQCVLLQCAHVWNWLRQTDTLTKFVLSCSMS